MGDSSGHQCEPCLTTGGGEQLQSSAERPGDRTADVGSNHGTLMEQVRSDTSAALCRGLWTFG